MLAAINATTVFLALVWQALWEAYIERALEALHLYHVTDVTYGRSKVPFSSMEKRLHRRPDVNIWFGTVLLDNQRDFVWYQVWESNTAPPPRPGRRPDILFAHGTSVHSGTIASHAQRFLQAGFRLIVPDLPSHGYSSGRHVYQRHMSAYTESLHAVLHDVARHDDVRDGTTSTGKRSRARHQPTFILGNSFGGTAALHYAVDYPESLRDSAAVAEGHEIPVDGINVVGPILGYSAQNIPMSSLVICLIAALDAIGAGCVEVGVPHKKCLDKDPTVYQTLIDADQRSYRGAFRAGHYMCINEAVNRLHLRAASICHPVYIQQGGQDRVACPKKTVEWIQRLDAQDKRMSVYPVCQHVIFRKSNDSEQDLAGRVPCIEDSIDWMLARLFSGLCPDLSSDQDAGFRSLPGPAMVTPASTSTSGSTSPVTQTSTLDKSSTASMTSTSDSPSSLHHSPSDFAKRLDEMQAGAQLTSSRSDEVTARQYMAQPLPSPDTASALGAPLAGKTAPLTYDGDLVTIDSSESYDHPLLAASHKTTLPTLAVLCPRRRYRPRWPHARELCPFDIDAFPEWTPEHRAALNTAAERMTLWTGFS